MRRSTEYGSLPLFRLVVKRIYQKYMMISDTCLSLRIGMIIVFLEYRE